MYPADDLLLRARVLRRAAETQSRPRHELLRELAQLIAEVRARLDARRQQPDGALLP
jgi:hypothetical protein